MDDATLVLTIVGVVIGTVAAVAAIFAAIYAYPAWRASRRRPKVRLVVDVHSASRPSGHREVHMFLRLNNYGDGPAVGWRFLLVPGKHSWERWGKAVGRYRTERQPDGRLVHSWQSASADDTIEAGRDARIGVHLREYDEERVEAQYILDTVGMDTYRGTIEVSWPEGEEIPSVRPRATTWGRLGLLHEQQHG